MRLESVPMTQTSDGQGRQRGTVLRPPVEFTVSQYESEVPRMDANLEQILGTPVRDLQRRDLEIVQDALNRITLRGTSGKTIGEVLGVTNEEERNGTSAGE